MTQVSKTPRCFYSQRSPIELKPELQGEAHGALEEIDWARWTV